MQTISEVMTRDVMTISPHDTLQRAAQMMDDLNVGSLPVCDGERLVGMITDRDIIVRSTSVAQDPDDVHVEEVMSMDVRWCFDDQSVDDVMQQMADVQIRRVPVIEHDTKKLVGIVSLGDLATRSTEEEEVEETLKDVSTPSQPDRPPLNS